MPQPQTKKQDELEESDPMEHAPRKYTTSQTAGITAKIVGLCGLLGGLLWVLDEAVSK